MQVPIRLQADASRTLQEQLFEEFVEQIASGRLKPGMRVPATRQLAAELGVSRNTVAFAYERLTAEGFIEPRPPQGTFVTALGVRPIGAASQAAADAPCAAGTRAPGASPPAAAPEAAGAARRRPVLRASMHALESPRAADGARAAFDFWVGRPDPRLFPARSARKLIEQSLAAMQYDDGTYGDPAGLPRLRSAVAAHLGATRGIVCSADDVIVTNGIQEGINIVARLLLRAGDGVGMEDPGYAGAAQVFTSHDARVLPVPVDAEGAVSGSLPRDVRLAYLTPAHQYPSGVSLSPRRRAEWMAWAQRCGGYLIEDDYDADFWYDSAPLPALKADDPHDQVIYLGTFSKSLAASLRLGYMVVPAELRRDAVTVKGLLTNGSPWLIQAAMAAFVDGGGFVHQLRRLRRHYAQRRDALAAALGRHLGEVTLTGAHAGLHVLWQVAPGLPPALEIERRARAHGVGVYSLRSGNAWCADAGTERRWERALMLGYAALDENEIAAGIERLARALKRAN